MKKLTLDLGTLQVQSFTPDDPAAVERAPGIATANTCYRTCGVTHCFC
jgi:hypothetical protein